MSIVSVSISTPKSSALSSVYFHKERMTTIGWKLLKAETLFKHQEHEAARSSYLKVHQMLRSQTTIGIETFILSYCSLRIACTYPTNTACRIFEKSYAWSEIERIFTDRDSWREWSTEHQIDAYKGMIANLNSLITLETNAQDLLVLRSRKEICRLALNTLQPT
jgi:hypothetical protein